MTQFAEFSWDATNIFRLFTVLAVMAFLFRMVTMMSYYWHRIIPLRKEMDKRVLIAPPIGWTFTYHLLVTAFIGLAGAGMVQAVYNGSPWTIFTFVAPFLIIALTVVVGQFVKYYSQNLNEERWRQIRED